MHEAFSEPHVRARVSDSHELCPCRGPQTGVIRMPRLRRQPKVVPRPPHRHVDALVQRGLLSRGSSHLAGEPSGVQREPAHRVGVGGLLNACKGLVVRQHARVRRLRHDCLQLALRELDLHEPCEPRDGGGMVEQDVLVEEDEHALATARPTRCERLQRSLDVACLEEKGAHLRLRQRAVDGPQRRQEARDGDHHVNGVTEDPDLLVRAGGPVLPLEMRLEHARRRLVWSVGFVVEAGAAEVRRTKSIHPRHHVVLVFKGDLAAVHPDLMAHVRDPGRAGLWWGEHDDVRLGEADLGRAAMSIATLPQRKHAVYHGPHPRARSSIQDKVSDGDHPAARVAPV
mmetsp:Transcript_67335/g.140280  ORF Transcript_67335/g.140280 Transcript_67335/m.140280 type:complete len:342 (+) Transcript_67335:209-1234(+)